MSAQTNMALANEIYRCFSRNDFAGVLAKTNEDVEVVFTSAGQTFHGPDEFIQFMQGFKTAFPDIELEVVNQTATDDQVVSEFIARGKHTGPLMGPAGAIPPTGRYAEWPVCEVWQVRDGKLSKITNYQDSATMLRQLGVLEA